MNDGKIGMMKRVRLTEVGARRFPDLAGKVGSVHSDGGVRVQVTWPEFRSWHRLIDLELAE